MTATGSKLLRRGGPKARRPNMAENRIELSVERKTNRQSCLDNNGLTNMSRLRGPTNLRSQHSAGGYFEAQERVLPSFGESGEAKQEVESQKIDEVSKRADYWGEGLMRKGAGHLLSRRSLGPMLLLQGNEALSP